MDAAEIGIIIIVIALYVTFSLRDAKVSAKALDYSYNMGLDIFFLFTSGIAIVGAMMVLIPGNIVIATLGKQTGLWGILIGVAIGSVLPAGGYIRLPVVLALLTLGAGVGTVVAILATRSLLYIPQSIAFFGIRVESVLIPSFLICGFSAGLFAHVIASIFL
jgi:uncharacterized membrane protein YraQ (UPF0718 family)